MDRLDYLRRSVMEMLNSGYTPEEIQVSHYPEFTSEEVNQMIDCICATSEIIFEYLPELSLN